jgi:hypothetical protein
MLRASWAGRVNGQVQLVVRMMAFLLLGVMWQLSRL